MAIKSNVVANIFGPCAMFYLQKMSWSMVMLMSPLFLVSKTRNRMPIMKIISVIQFPKPAFLFFIIRTALLLEIL